VIFISSWQPYFGSFLDIVQGNKREKRKRREREKK